MSSTEETTRPWPAEIRLGKAKDLLTVAFDNGECFELTAEYLRVESPSAEVKGHSEAQRQTVPGKRHVRISALEPVGNYAVRILFEDGHDTGLYSWAYLLELGREYETKWHHYLEDLAAKGLTRE